MASHVGLAERFTDVGGILLLSDVVEFFSHSCLVLCLNDFLKILISIGFDAIGLVEVELLYIFYEAWMDYANSWLSMSGSPIFANVLWGCGSLSGLLVFLLQMDILSYTVINGVICAEWNPPCWFIAGIWVWS